MIGIEELKAKEIEVAAQRKKVVNAINKGCKYIKKCSQLRILDAAMTHSLPKKIAEHAGMYSTSLSRIWSKMEDSGLIKITISCEDMRYKTVTVTKKGRDDLKRFERAYNELND